MCEKLRNQIILTQKYELSIYTLGHYYGISSNNMMITLNNMFMWIIFKAYSKYTIFYQKIQNT